MQGGRSRCLGAFIKPISKPMQIMPSNPVSPGELSPCHRKREFSMSKVWFITGAGSGIGAATARAALKAGDRVVATGRNLDKLRNALSDVAGEDLAFVQLDVVHE